MCWKKIQKKAPHTTAKNVAPQAIAYLGLIGNTALAINDLKTLTREFSRLVMTILKSDFKNEKSGSNMAVPLRKNY